MPSARRRNAIGALLAVTLLLFGGALGVAATMGSAAGASGSLPAVVASISAGTNPFFAHYDSGTGNTYVSNFGSNNVTVFHDSTLAKFATTAVGTAPKGLDYSPSTGAIWVPNSGTTTVSVINDTSNAVLVNIGGFTAPTRAESDPLDASMWITENITAQGLVKIVGLSNYTIWKTLTPGKNPIGLDKIILPDGFGYMLVANYGSANVSVYNLTTAALVTTIAVGTDPITPSCLTASTIYACYVSNLGSNSVSVINLTSLAVVASITVPTPYGGVSDSATGDVFVTELLHSAVAVISGLTRSVVTTITVGASPRDMTGGYDPVRGLIFIPNYGSNNVSVLSDGSGGGGGGAIVAPDTGGAIIAIACVLGILFVAFVSMGFAQRNSFN